MSNDKLYIKTDNGSIHIKKRSQIIVNIGEFNYINPTEEMLFNDGWEIYNTTELKPEELENTITLVDVRERKINSIVSYDSSQHVNIFFFNSYPIWLDKATRTGLKLRVDAEIMNEQYETTLWYNGVEFKLPTEYVQKMLYQVELYASACYDNTQRHIANVMKLQTIEEIENYDITEGYPTHLVFNIEA
jgi:hypothetical protein